MLTAHSNGCSGRGLARYLMAHVLFVAAALVPAIAMAEDAPKVFNTDIYIAMPQIDGQNYLQVGISMAESIELVVPDKAFDANGMATLDATMQGGSALKQQIEARFREVNSAFGETGAQFKIRTIYLVSSKNKQIKESFRADEGYFSFGDREVTLRRGDKVIKEKRSLLLEQFEQMTASNKDAFKILMAPILEEGKKGRSREPGNVAVVDTDAALNPLNKGFVFIHELGHNCGLDHGNSDAFRFAMAPLTPDRVRDPNQQADPKFTPDEIEIIKTRVARGIYDSFLEKDEKEKKPESAGQSGGKTSAVPKTTRTTKKASTGSSGGAAQGHSTKANAAVQFGIGVGLGILLNRGSGSSRGRRNQNQQQNWHR